VQPSGPLSGLAAEKTEWESFEPLPGPVGAPDDLKKLHGVSPAIEKQLNDLGFFHFSQVAALNAKDAHHLGETVGLPRPRRNLARGVQSTFGRHGVIHGRD